MTVDPRLLELPELLIEVQTLAVRDVDAGWALALERLGTLVRGRASSITIATRVQHDPEDPLLGWRPRVNVAPPSARERTFALAWMKDDANFVHDPGVQRQVSTWGSHRAARLCDLGTPEEVASWPTARLRRHNGVFDRVVAAHALSDKEELYAGFDRFEPPGFDETDRDFLAQAMAGLGRPCRWLTLSLGAMADTSPLTARERECLGYLLSSRPETEFARVLELSQARAHELVTAVLRKMRVSSRPELMSLWLRGA